MKGTDFKWRVLTFSILKLLPQLLRVKELLLLSIFPMRTVTSKSLFSFFCASIQRIARRAQQLFWKRNVKTRNKWALKSGYDTFPLRENWELKHWRGRLRGCHMIIYSNFAFLLTVLAFPYEIFLRLFNWISHELDIEQPVHYYQ